jgi:hypothetical protein
MDGNLQIGPKLKASRQPNPVKRLEQTLMVKSTVTWICKADGCSKHVPSPAKRMDVDDPGIEDPLDGRSRVGTYTGPSEGHQPLLSL